MFILLVHIIFIASDLSSCSVGYYSAVRRVQVRKGGKKEILDELRINDWMNYRRVGSRDIALKDNHQPKLATSISFPCTNLQSPLPSRNLIPK